MAAKFGNASNFKHGKRKHPLYQVWSSMKKRCLNKNCKDYKWYGGNGITVCKEWLEFKEFYKWAIKGWKSGLTIERKNNKIGYLPSNCTWVKKSEQNSNKRNNVVLTHNGITQNLTKWSTQIGVAFTVLQTRLKRGWSIERTLTEKVNKPILILVDTREQKPLKFINSARKTLNTGDYTTPLLNGVFVAERKSPGDLYGTVLKGHSRFRKEINRAATQGITIVVFVECTAKIFYTKKYAGAERHEYPSIVIKKIISTISTRYGIEFVWCKNRKQMAEIILKRFRKEERKLKERLNVHHYQTQIYPAKYLKELT